MYLCSLVISKFDKSKINLARYKETHQALHLLLFMHFLLDQNKFNFISAVASILDASLPNNSLKLDRVKDAKEMIVMSLEDL